MNKANKQTEETANKLLAQFSIKQLCEQWEVTNKQSVTIELAKVRGWLQNELERRDQVKFDSWINCPDVDKMDHPELFFLEVK